jgi:long-chain acyl-CoA synthetase
MTAMPMNAAPGGAAAHPATAATVLDMFDAAVIARGEHTALRDRDARGQWHGTSWAAYADAVRETAAGLCTLGVEIGDRAGILSFNRKEWHFADLGILTAAAISVPIYQTSAGPQIAYVLGHSEAAVCFVDNEEQYAKIVEHREEIPGLRHVVIFDESPPSIDGFFLSLTQLRAMGAKALADDPELLPRRRRLVQPSDLATLVYTSGTTGPPKGTMITHANLMATMRSITSLLSFDSNDRFLSFLPLSHITERCVSHFGLLVSTGETWFARSITTVAEDLVDCRPTVFFAVPRVWEKFRDAIIEHASSVPGWRGPLARRYLELAPRRARELEHGVYMPFFTKSEWLALDRFVGTQLRARIGLDKARLLASGAAPIHPELLRWFLGIGLPIAEGYGQTEVSLATSLNPPGRVRLGSVGLPLPGISVRLADDGEILVKGDNVCAGYWRDPAATAALVDENGWLHSGDVGTIDPDGYLHITDRKKDIIITAHGKNVAPQTIETELALEPLIGHAVVIGDGRRYLTALVSLDTEAAAHWAEEHGRAFSLEALTEDPDIRDAIESAIAAVNDRHARVEQVRKWRLLPNEMGVATGELTPTLKVKRNVVNAKYRDVIEEMYAS